MISFNQISAFIRTPGTYVEFDNSMAIRGLVLDQTKTVMFGQKLATGSSTALVPVRVLSADQAVQLFGRGSMLAAMVRKFRAANTDSDLWVVPQVDNPAGVAAAGTVTVTGPSTAAGTLNLYIGGERVQVAVASAATANAVATSIAAAINANLDLVVTAAAVAAVVTITARHKGEAFNGLDIRVNYNDGEALPAGIALAIVQPAAGTANPDVTAALVALSDTHFHYAVMPWTDAANLTALVTEFTDRWSGMRQIEGQVWAAHAGNHAALTSLGNSLNSEVLSIMAAYGSPTPAYLWAAIYAAVVLAALDLDPARPVQSLWLRGALAPAEASRFTRAERNLLLYDGISTCTVQQGGRVQIDRGITTYQVNLYGLPDPSYLDVETPATLAVLRRTLRARISQKFPRHKLADDGTNFGPGQAIVTPSIIRAELLSLAREWEQRGWIENLDAFKDQLIVMRNEDDPNRIDAVIPPDLINQLRVFAGLVQFRV